jgi:DNA polymerase-1
LKTLFVIDASGYLYRSYFAIRSMTNDKGESTNALFGFIRSLLKLLKDFKPHYAVAVFDGPKNSAKRTAIYPAYKAHRSEMPQDLLYQIEWARNFCSLFGLPMLNIGGVEADDVMGSVGAWGASEGFDVRLCTTDKDLCQLVNDRIMLLDTFKENKLIGPKEVEEKFGVPPSLMRDFLALTGDSSDNVPGVPGVGPKTAAEMLKASGGLKSLLEHPENYVAEKRQALIKTHRQDALTSFDLVTLDLNADFPKEVPFFEIKPPSKAELKGFYSSMQFNSLLRELEASHPTEKTGAPPSSSKYHLIKNKEELEQLLHKLSVHKAICIDTETTNLTPRDAKLVGIGLGIAPEEAWYIPFNGELAPEYLKERLKPFFGDKERGFYGHNIKYDAHVLVHEGIPIGRFCFDTLVASYLLNTHSRRHSLDELSLEYFQFIKTPI